MKANRLLATYIRVVDRVGGVRTNLRRLFRPWLRRREWQKGARAVGALREVPDLLRESRAALSEEHSRYTTSVSDEVFALSLEVCAFLDAYCRVARPTRILDLGSGFSSYVFRRYQKTRGGEVFVRTLDDDGRWLARTAEYLSEHGLSTEALGLLTDPGSEDAGSFDLVCHDLGNFETRERFLPMAIDAARPASGTLVLDDCHRRPYWEVARTELERRDATIVPLLQATRDSVGRFAVLASGISRPESR